MQCIPKPQFKGVKNEQNNLTNSVECLYFHASSRRGNQVG
jgi:hypothetical protein